tara:strand:- start:102 stop:578 length:477 start_codon:yes stop_codon:yes gene_type:complete
MALSIAEVLGEVEKAKTREEKREVLKKNESWSLRALLQQNFHPQASWLIPPGSPPYNANQNSADTSLLYEAKKLEYYTSGKQKIPMLKREAMFVSLLERLSPDEAKIIIAVKDQKLSYKGLTYKLVKDTWPDLLPEQEEKLTTSVTEEEEPDVEVEST